MALLFMSPEPAMTDAPIMIFDTDCVLCSGVVSFVLRNESDDQLRFAGAWSPEGLDLATRYGFTRADLEQTFLVVTEGRALPRSDGFLVVAGHLRAPWRWLRVLRVVPRPIRDAIYSFIARHRYQWFGRKDDCALVPPSQRHRFVGVRST